MGDKELSILLKTKDQSSAEFKKVDKAARELGQQMKAHGIKGGEGLKVIRGEMTKLEAEAKKLGVSGTKSLASLQTQVQKLEATTKKSKMSWDDMKSAYSSAAIGMAAVAGAAYSVYRMFDATILSTARLVDDMGDLSAKTGISADSLLKLKYAADMADVDFDLLAKSVQRLNRITGDAAAGNKVAKKSFKELGINIRDNNKQLKDSDTIFLEVIDKISKMKTIQEQNAAAQKFFGKSAADILPILNLGKEGMAAYMDEAERMGLKISPELEKQAGDFDSWGKKIGHQLQGLKIGITEDVLPSMNKLMEGWSNLLDLLNQYGTWDTLQSVVVVVNEQIANAFIGMGEAVIEGWTVMWEELSGVASAWGDRLLSESSVFAGAVVSAFESMKTNALAVVSDMWSGITTVFELGFEKVKNAIINMKNDVLNVFRLLKDEAVTHSIIPDMVTDIERWFGRLETTAPASAKRMADSVEKIYGGIETPETMARPDRPQKGKAKPKTAAEIEYEKQQAIYEARQSDIKAAKDYNKIMEDLYREGLTAKERERYDMERAHQEELRIIRESYAAMSAEQQAKVDLQKAEERATAAHNRRLLMLNMKAVGDQKKAEAASAKADKESKKAQQAAYKSSVQSAANILGVGLDMQAAVMIPWEIAEAATDFADFLTTKDATLLASSLAHGEAAKGWADAAKGAGGGGGGGGKGGKGGGGGGGGKGRRDRGDLPGRNSEPPMPQGWGEITIDTGRLKGKMLMGDAGDIMDWTLAQLNSKYRQNAKILWT